MKELSIVKSLAELTSSSAEKRLKTPVIKLNEKDLEVESTRIMMEWILAEYTKFQDVMMNERGYEVAKVFLSACAIITVAQNFNYIRWGIVGEHNTKHIAACCTDMKSTNHNCLFNVKC